MKTVRLENNIVVEVIPSYALPVKKWYGDAFAARCIEAPEYVEQHWTYNPETDTWAKPESPSTEPITEAEKIDEIKKNCEDYIYAGTSVTYADGTVEHFTYSLVDQSNISEMFTAVMAGATEYPYHADGEICKIYSKEQIITIYGTLSLFKTEATTYHNSLKAQIKAMTDADTIAAVKFKETELTGEYLENYVSMMVSAKAQLEAILARIPTDETTTA